MTTTLRVQLVTLTLLASSCGGKVVSSTPFEDGHASMKIEKTKWEGQSLWIAFSLECPYGWQKKKGYSRKKEKERVPVYDFEGTFIMKSGDYTYNDEVLHLSSLEFPLSTVGSRRFISSGQSCDLIESWCSLEGRIRIMDLDHIEPGTKLEIAATLPDTAGKAKLHEAELQFRSK